MVYKGYTLVYAPVKPPGGNIFHGYRVLGTSIHATWSVCKAAIDKVS